MTCGRVRTFNTSQGATKRSKWIPRLKLHCKNNTNRNQIIPVHAVLPYRGIVCIVSMAGWYLSSAAIKYSSCTTIDSSNKKCQESSEVIIQREISMILLLYHVVWHKGWLLILEVLLFSQIQHIVAILAEHMADCL